MKPQPTPDNVNRHGLSGVMVGYGIYGYISGMQMIATIMAIVHWNATTEINRHRVYTWTYVEAGP